jgi:hypothetical protein
MYRQYDTNQQRSVLSSFFEAAAEDEKWKEVLQSSDLANMFSLKQRETYIFDDNGRVETVDQTERYSEDEKGIKNILKDDVGKIYPELQKQFTARAEEMRKMYDTTDGKIEGLTYGTPEYEKATAELEKLGTGLNAIGDQK